MNNKPDVSVVIIFLNAEQFIEEAIESVFAQTYKNWELVLVDDGSSDSSTDIAKRYAKEFPQKIKYLEHENHKNRGMSASRNLGIKNAVGNYIALLDADDVWLPQKLEQQVAIFESHPRAGMVYGLSQYWHNWTGNGEDGEQDHIPIPNFSMNTLIEPPNLLLKSYPLGDSIAPCPSDLIFKRNVFERIGGFEESFTGDYQLYEDQAFLTKVYLNEPVYIADQCWDKYRQHPNSCVSTVNQAGQYHKVRHFFLKWLEDYFSKQGVNDQDILNAYQRSMWPYHHPILHQFSGIYRSFKDGAVHFAEQKLPPQYFQLLMSWLHITYRPAIGMVRFGSFRRLSPISEYFGFDRGAPIDRYYIEEFLADHSDDIKGRVMEIGDNRYTLMFGEQVEQSDILHVTDNNSNATIVGDLANADHIPSDTFDCLIITQTLHLIYDMRAAIKTLYRILKPGGVLLLTVPGITRISNDEWRNTWYWSLTDLSTKKLFSEIFPETNLNTQVYGNVLAATAFLQGLAVKELKKKELDYSDTHFQVIIAVRAVKP